MVFSNSSTGLGIVEQTRVLMRVDATQWPTARIVASTNNYLETVTGYAIGADRRFQWDDTNHTKLPIGTTNLVADQKEYSFLTDEQGNTILNLTRIDKEGGQVKLVEPSNGYKDRYMAVAYASYICSTEFERKLNKIKKKKSSFNFQYTPQDYFNN